MWLQRTQPFPPVVGPAREDERSKLVRKVAALRKRASRTKFTTGLDHYAEETLNTVSVCVCLGRWWGGFDQFFFGTTFVSFFGTFGIFFYF